MLDRVIGRVLVTAAVVALGGCAGATLPYTPEQQPAGARLSAAYFVLGDRLGVEIDTDDRRLEAALILRPDGSELHPQTIEHAPLVYSPGVSVGVGVGGVSGGGHRGVGVGTGVGVGIPVGGSSRVQGNTVAYFPLEQAGPAPWRVLVKVAGISPALIVVGGTPTGGR